MIILPSTLCVFQTSDVEIKSLERLKDELPFLTFSFSSSIALFIEILNCLYLQFKLLQLLMLLTSFDYRYNILWEFFNGKGGLNSPGEKCDKSVFCNPEKWKHVTRMLPRHNSVIDF